MYSTRRWSQISLLAGILVFMTTYLEQIWAEKSEQGEGLIAKHSDLIRFWSGDVSRGFRGKLTLWNGTQTPLAITILCLWQVTEWSGEPWSLMSTLNVVLDNDDDNNNNDAAAADDDDNNEREEERRNNEALKVSTLQALAVSIPMFEELSLHCAFTRQVQAVFIPLVSLLLLLPSHNYKLYTEKRSAQHSKRNDHQCLCFVDPMMNPVFFWNSKVELDQWPEQECVCLWISCHSLGTALQWMMSCCWLSVVALYANLIFMALFVLYYAALMYGRPLCQRWPLLLGPLD